MIEIVNKLIRTSRQLVQALGREPTSAEIAKRMDIPAAKVQKLRKIMQEPISLEAPISKQGDSHLSDFIEDRSVVSPAQATINVKLKEQTAHVLHTLSAREEKVVRMRFGLEDGTRWRRLAGLSLSLASASARSKPKRCASCAARRAPASSRHCSNRSTNEARPETNGLAGCRWRAG